MAESLNCVFYNVITESKADDVTVSCHWDQMSGPPIDLGDSSNKWILNLSNLDIGNYTFRYLYFVL